MISVLRRVAGQMLTIDSKPIFSVGYSPIVFFELSITVFQNVIACDFCADTDTIDKAGGVEAYLKDLLMPDRWDLVYLIFDKSGCMKTTLSSGDGAYRSEVAVADRWYAERFNALMDDYSWVKSRSDPDIDSLKRASDLVLTVSSSDGRQSLTFFSGSNFALCASNANTRWYEVKAVNGSALFGAMRTEFDNLEAKDALDKIKVYNTGSDFQKIAEAFAREYLKNITGLSPGSVYRITDCKMTNCAVSLTDANDKTKFTFNLTFVVKPADFENTYWWAGNTVTGDYLKNSGFNAIPESELKNWLYLGREIRLDYDAAGGFWHCTNCGTGGVTLG